MRFYVTAMREDYSTAMRRVGAGHYADRRSIFNKYQMSFQETTPKRR